MKQLKNILVATDFSQSSNNIIKNAIDLAKKFQSEIILVHVIHDDIKDKKAKKLLQEVTQNQLNTLSFRINKEGVKNDLKLIEYGNYSDKIVKLAEEHNANLIILGSGEKLINNIPQLGKTTASVIQKSNKPVFVVKENKVLNISNILCPVDFSKASSRALTNAITIAKEIKAKLYVLNIYQIDYPSMYDSKMEWDEENNVKKMKHSKKFESFIKDFNFTGLDWTKEILGGNLAQEIRKAVRKYNSSLLIMGTTTKSGLSRMLKGSITEDVIKQVPCSFIIQKSKEIMEKS